MKLNWQHWGVIAIGMLVFVLLFFADKTTLENDREQTVDGSGVRDKAGQTNPQPLMEEKDLISLLPPLELSPSRDSLLKELEMVSTPAQRVPLLQALVEGLQRENRLDAAAVYADQLAIEQPSAKHLLVAGALFRTATQAPGLLEDTDLFRTFSDRALSNLERAKELEPENEEVLIELGLAYIQSNAPENSMSGIQSLLKVLEVNPDNAEAAFHLGMFSIQTGQFEKAELRFNKVLEVQPQNTLAKYYLATVYLETGKQQAAIPLLQDVANQNQDLLLAGEAKNILSSFKK